VPKSTFSRKYDYFRALLIEARRNAKLTQVDLAERLRRPQSFVSKYERGERRLDVIEFLDVAVVLRIDVSTFLKKLDGKAAP
jgi:transcriptional regulator with XRE-family HTH domain